jgi:hypothetical protein
MSSAINTSHLNPNPILDKEVWKEKGLKAINARLERQKWCEDRYDKVDPEYEDLYTVKTRAQHIAAAALVLISIIAVVTFFSLAFSGQLLTFPQDFIHAFTHINHTHLAIGLGIATVIIGSASFIIYRTVNRKEKLLAPLKVTYVDEKGEECVVDSLCKVPDDPAKAKKENAVTSPLLPKTKRTCFVEIPYDAPSQSKKFPIIKREFGEGVSRGAFTHLDEHLETVILTRPGKKNVTYDAYLDKSTLDENLCGKAFLYEAKTPLDHYIINVLLILGAPILLIGVIVYNLLRMVIAPIYVLIQILIEKFKNKGTPQFPQECPYDEIKGRNFEWIDIPREFFRSVLNILEAVPYFAAYEMLLFANLFKPVQMRKLIGALERDWNGEMTLENAFWSRKGFQKFGTGERGGGPLLMGRFGFYLAGCYQPFGIAEVDHGKIIGYWMAALTDPNVLVFYDISTLTALEAATEEYEILLQAKLELLRAPRPPSSNSDSEDATSTSEDEDSCSTSVSEGTASDSEGETTDSE